jgi:hypothetical protein
MPDDEDQSVSSSGSDDAVMDCGHARKWSLTNPCWCLSPSDVGLRACHGRAFVFDPISSDEEYSAGAGSAAVCAGSVHVEAAVKDDLASCPRPTHRAPVAECFESEPSRDFLETVRSAQLIPRRLKHACTYFDETDMHVACRHALTCARDPYSFERSIERDYDTDIDYGVEFEVYYRVNWLCDRCGVEGRLRQVYSCRPCGLDLCVSCALRVEESPHQRPPSVPMVRWLDLHGQPGRHDGPPEDLAGEVDCMKDAFVEDEDDDDDDDDEDEDDDNNNNDDSDDER